MATTKRLIESSLRTIGVLASGEGARPSELRDALLYANQLLDSWSNEGLLVTAMAHEQFTPADLKAEYTIGPATTPPSTPPVDLDTARPLAIKTVYLSIDGASRYPVEYAPLDMFQRMSSASVGPPGYWHYIPEWPWGRLQFSSSPPQFTMSLVSIKPIDELPDLHDEISMQPGYERLLRLGLAIELAPEYGSQVPTALAAQYREAYQNIKRTNSQSRLTEMRVDPALIGNTQFDIRYGP